MTFSQMCSKVYFLTNTNSTSFPIADLTAAINNANERVVSLIRSSDSRWQWDDPNQPATDQGDGTGGLPIATTTITNGQQDYALTTGFLSILRVEVKDSSGNWKLLTPLDQVDIYDQSVTDFLKGGGLPTYYDKLGNSVILYPSPNYTQSASLKVFFERAPIAFTTGDTTKQPGFNSLYHNLLPLWVSYDYALSKGLTKANLIFQDIQLLEDQLKEDYSLRNKDDRPRMEAKHSFRSFFR